MGGGDQSRHARPGPVARLGRTLALAWSHLGELALKLAGALWPPNALMAARHGAGLVRGRRAPSRELDLDSAIDASVDWLCHSQDKVGSGGVGCYELYRWTPGYPEVTGYIVPTLWDCRHRLGRPELGDRAVRATDWELGVQQPEGGFEGGYQGDGQPPVVFNTGQVIRGLLRTAEETGEARYLDAAVRAGRWIVANQEEDGSWAKANFKGMKRVYDSYVSAPLARLANVTGDAAFSDAAVRNCEFVLSNQRPNGWFELCDNNPRYNDAPLTHTICYTIDGLRETGEALGEERFVAAAALAADRMLELVEDSPRLSARLDEEWRPRARYVCVTGAAQLGGILMKLHARSGDERRRRAALDLVAWLADVQRTSGSGAPRRGALPGSYPIWGMYAPLKMPSWGVKYFLDLLLLVRADGGEPPPAATEGAAAPAGAG